MAQGAKKKQKAEATDVYGDVRTRLAEHVEAAAGPEDGTTVRFDYTFDNADARYDNGKRIKRNWYTYVAVWIANQWYVTGMNDSVTRKQSHQAFMTMLASDKVRRAQVATVFDTFKA